MRCRNQGLCDARWAIPDTGGPAASGTRAKAYCGTDNEDVVHGTTRTEAGYTVLETVVALAILMGAVFGVVQLYIVGMKATKEANEELVAARLMRNELEARRMAARTGLQVVDQVPLRALAQEGEALAELAGAVRVAKREAGPAGVFEVTVRLHWRGAGGRPVLRSMMQLIAAKEIAP